MTNTKRDKIMEGHRLIRDFQREREIPEEIVSFQWKELELVRRQLTESINDLKIEFDKNMDNTERQGDIFDDVGMIKHYIDSIENIERGFRKISKKYGWDK